MVSQGKAYIGLLIGLSVTVLVALAGVLTWPNHLELKLLDYRMRHFGFTSNRSDNLVIAIDDNSLEQVGRWPWPRRYLGHALRLCREAGASGVLLDVMMPEEQKIEFVLPGVTDASPFEPRATIVGDSVPVPINNDELLAGDIRRAGNVIIPFHAQLAEFTAQPTVEPVTNEGDELDRQLISLLEQDKDLTFEQAFDLLLPGKDIHERDMDYHQLLLSYIRSKSQVALKRFGFVRRPNQIAMPIRGVKDFIPPIPQFAEVADNCGFVTVEKDSDGVVRRIPLLCQYQGVLYKQIAFTAACRALDIKDDDIDLSVPGKIVLKGRDVQIPLDKEGNMMVSWAGDWEEQAQQEQSYIPITQVVQIWQKQKALDDNARQLRMIEEIDFQLSTVPDDITELDKETQQLIALKRQQRSLLSDPAKLRLTNDQLQKEIEADKAKLKQLVEGKIVLIGSIAAGTADDFEVTPWNKTGTPGIEIHRNIINTIMENSFVYRPSRAVEILLVVILGLLMTALTAVFRPLVSGLTLVALIAIAIVINFVFIFGYFHYWLAVVEPTAAILGSFTAVTFYRQITEGHAKRMITARFKQYTSPAVVDRIVKMGTDVSFAGEIRQISCFFSDLAGFTTISEKLGPEKTVHILNIYLDRMTEVLDRFDATINKFEGDGIFAFFGAPVSLSDHAQLACLSAIHSQRELALLVKEQRQVNNDFPQLRMRTGICSGPAVVGDCGSRRRFDYTAIGDTVNLAARLESANKAFGSLNMISESTYQLACDVIETRYLGKVRVVGKKIGVGIYELLSETDGLTAQQKEYTQQFESAVELFQDKQFDKSMKSFQQALGQRSDDKAATLYIDTIKQFAKDGPPEDFDGCIELTAK